MIHLNRRFQVYPNIYLWTSFPLACALKVLHSQATLHIAHLRSNEPQHAALDYSRILIAHFFLIEITAMFERISVFGQTGNARVLNPTIMDPLQLTVVARKGMLPYFGNAISFHDGTGPLTIRFSGSHWPFDPQTKSPLMSSLASLKFHYGQPFSEVSLVFIADNFLVRYRGLATMGLSSSAAFRR